MQNWKDLYIELSELISENVAGVRWVDLWHNQISFLSEEHPFPAPAVFLSFRILDASDTGEYVQQLTLQVDCFIYHETLADTFRGSFNQGSALGFLDLVNDTYAALHGSSGENYNEMRRTGFSPVDTGGAGNLYQLTFNCYLLDYSACATFENARIKDVRVVEKDRGSEPVHDSEPLYRI
jgi:hypothetical protein